MYQEFGFEKGNYDVNGRHPPEKTNPIFDAKYPE